MYWKKRFTRFVFLFVVFIIVLNHQTNLSRSEENPKSTKEQIEIAQKINTIEETFNKKDKISLKRFVHDNDSKIRRIATDKIRELDAEEGIKGRKIEADSLQKKSKNIFENERIRVKNELEKFPKTERDKKAIEILTNWKSVYEYEGAILALIESGNDVIPAVLELLNNPVNIPMQSGPPWDRTHTIYHIVLVVLKSIPDDRSLPKLEELSKSDIKYVSEKAKNALEWIKSGVPYPFKYERILFAAEDDISPDQIKE